MTTRRRFLRKPTQGRKPVEELTADEAEGKGHTRARIRQAIGGFLLVRSMTRSPCLDIALDVNFAGIAPRAPRGVTISGGGHVTDSPLEPTYDTKRKGKGRAHPFVDGEPLCSCGKRTVFAREYDTVNNLVSWANRDDTLCKPGKAALLATMSF